MVQIFSEFGLEANFPMWPEVEEIFFKVFGLVFGRNC